MMYENIEVYDELGNLLEEYDLDLGYMKPSTRTIHHDAIEGVEEQWHWEVIAEYPNGGKDVQKAIDVAGVEAKDAWDEEIPIYIYILYTEEELAAIEAEKNKPTLEEQVAEQQAQIDMLTECLLEMSEMVYG